MHVSETTVLFVWMKSWNRADPLHQKSGRTGLDPVLRFLCKVETVQSGFKPKRNISVQFYVVSPKTVFELCVKRFWNAQSYENIWEHISLHKNSLFIQQKDNSGMYFISSSFPTSEYWGFHKHLFLVKQYLDVQNGVSCKSWLCNNLGIVVILLIVQYWLLATLN